MDLPNHSNRTLAIAYADDITYLHHVSLNSSNQLQNDLDSLIDWCSEIGLIINVSKTKRMILSRQTISAVDIPLISLNGNNLPTETSIKILGVFIDNNMKWRTQAKYVQSKCARAMSQVRQLQKIGCNHSTLWQVYCSIVRSHILYCWPVWCD